MMMTEGRIKENGYVITQNWKVVIRAKQVIIWENKISVNEERQ